MPRGIWRRRRGRNCARRRSGTARPTTRRSARCTTRNTRRKTPCRSAMTGSRKRATKRRGAGPRSRRTARGCCPSTGSKPRIRSEDQMTELPAGTLEDWIEATRALARRGRVAKAETDLAAITAHAGRGGVRVAVVSTTPRTRSRLVNQLADRNVLPSDPGADVPVLITAGSENHLEAQTESGWSTRPADVAGRWWQAGEPPVLAFRLQAAGGPLAAAPGVELISVPMPGNRDPGDPRWAALASADAVIMPVQATVAMTRTETIFLEELLQTGTAADHVLILLTRMDLVEEDERAGLLDHVRDRAQAIRAPFTVLPAQPGAGGEPELAQAARTWITRSVLTDHGSARAQQLARQLAGCLHQVAASAANAAQEAAREQARHAEAITAQEAAHADDLRAFDEIREDVRSRHNAVLAEFLRFRDRFAAQLFGALGHQLDAISDPADWWERELPYQLETRLPALGQHVRLELGQQVNSHLHALSGALNTRFGVQLGQLAGMAVTEPDVPAPGSLKLRSLRRRRMLYRTTPSGVALVAILAIPGIGPVAGITASLVGTGLAEIRLRSLAEDQRVEIRKRLPGLIDLALNDYGNRVCTAVAEIYQQQEDEIGRLREQWKPTGAGPLPAAGDGPGPWEALRAECEALAGKIRSETEA